MAQGTLTVFNAAAESIGEKLIDLENDTFFMAFTSTVPSTSASDPRWGSGGSTNLSTDEVSGTNYTAGGNTLGAGSNVLSGAVATFDLADPAQWVTDGSGPTNIKSAIIYDNTDAGKRAWAWIDMTTDGGTTPVSLAAGNIDVAINASGVSTVTRS